MHISSGLNNDIIRVGIVLPEDKLHTISLSWAPHLGISADFPGLGTTHQIALSTEAGKIRINGATTHELLDEITLICPDDISLLSAEYGIHVEPVIAGRGFHWEKPIAVDLPGQLKISVQDDCFKIINSVNIEAYVACVATSEMGAEAPSALLAAQTVVARCWSLALAEAKHISEGFDVCNDDCCQRYQGTTFLTSHSLKAAIDTRGEVLVYDNQVIDARYSKNCGGMVEAYETVWAGGPVPYLVPLWDAPLQRAGYAVDRIDDFWAYDDAYCSTKRFDSVNLAEMLGKVDVSGSYYRWEQQLSKSDLLKNLNKYTGIIWKQITGIRIMERGPSTRIKFLFLEGIDELGAYAEQLVKSEYGIRQMFSNSFLYSSAFVIKNAQTLKEDNHIVLQGAGWGHGVGLCQMGALGMALDKIDYKDILLHYYPGTRFTTL
ncbi:MAG: SpoIID/LytB domain-containing protein [Candidatus Marinimicrobia bacterium]|nr:SpoIID/LytB domain-containing protein [Candidatus Neomarinimicrobiota bacterium]